MPYHLASRLLPGRLVVRRKGLLLALILTLTFSLAPLLSAQDADDSDFQDSNVRIVRISYVEGEVRMDSGHGWENLTMNVPVTERNWLQTRSDGWAEVQFEDGSLLRLAPDSQVIFTDLNRSSSGGTVTTVDLDLGEAEFKLAKHNDSDFQVTVKNKTIVLVHSGTFRVTSTGANPMEVVVFKGEVAIRDSESGDQIAVKNNETFALDPANLGSYRLETGTDADALDDWSNQRDDYLSTYASTGSYTQSPYQYGASDLGYYGQYYDLPGYGYVWQPNGVGVGWDPFSNGYWDYSPGFGYAWVSSYPWGWLPFRYGHWVFVNGRGWCWVPGRWKEWHTGPRWTNAPPGFRPPVHPPDRKEVPKVGGGTGHLPGPGIRVPGSLRVDRDRDGDAAQAGRERSTRRVLTDDDVQPKVLRSDFPAPQPTEHKPAIVDQRQQPEGGTVIHRGQEGKFRGDREQVSLPSVSRANDRPATPPVRSQPLRQYNPQPQSYSPLPSRHENPSPLPAPQVHRSDSPPSPPPAPAQHSAPPAAAPTSSPGRPH